MQPTPTTPPPPWDKQPGDTPKAWNAFTIYRDLGPSRTLAAAALQMGRNRQTLADWSARHAWQFRVEAWDREQDRIKREASLRALAAMADRQAQQAMLAQTVASAAARSFLERSRGVNPAELFRITVTAEDGTTSEVDMPLHELYDLALNGARVLPAAQQAERLARGEPTEIVRQEGIIGVAEVGPTGVDRLQAVIDALRVVGFGNPAHPNALEAPEDPAE